MPNRTPKRTSGKRALAEQRNQADSMCWQLEKLIKEHEAKLNAADKEAVSKAIEKTREAAKGDDSTTSRQPCTNWSRPRTP